MLGAGGTGHLLFERHDSVESGSALNGPGRDEIRSSGAPAVLLVRVPEGPSREELWEAVLETPGVYAPRGSLTIRAPNSLEGVADSVRRRVEERTGYPARVELHTDPSSVEDLVGASRVLRGGRDVKLREEDVDRFYGCRMCQRVTPRHLCVITPDRPGNCGIDWLDARTCAEANPDGGIFEIRKGERLGPGRYTGVDEAVEEETGFDETRLHDALESPHPSCGCRCFDAVVFYVPELDGFGVVNGGHEGETPLGLTFEELAEMAAGRTPGIVGVSEGYLRSPAFLESNGGWGRVRWVTEEVRRTAADATDPEALRSVETDHLEV